MQDSKQDWFAYEFPPPHSDVLQAPLAHVKQSAKSFVSYRMAAHARQQNGESLHPEEDALKNRLHRCESFYRIKILRAILALCKSLLQWDPTSSTSSSSASTLSFTAEDAQRMSLHVCTVVQLFRELRRRVDRLYKELERIEQMPDETLAKLANDFNTAITDLKTTASSLHPRVAVPWQLEYNLLRLPVDGGVTSFEGGRVTDADGRVTNRATCALTGLEIQHWGVGEHQPRAVCMDDTTRAHVPWAHVAVTIAAHALTTGIRMALATARNNASAGTPGTDNVSVVAAAFASCGMEHVRSHCSLVRKLLTACEKDALSSALSTIPKDISKILEVGPDAFPTLSPGLFAAAAAAAAAPTPTTQSSAGRTSFAAAGVSQVQRDSCHFGPAAATWVRATQGYYKCTTRPQTMVALEVASSTKSTSMKQGKQQEEESTLWAFPDPYASNCRACINAIASCDLSEQEQQQGDGDNDATETFADDVDDDNFEDDVKLDTDISDTNAATSLAAAAFALSRSPVPGCEVTAFALTSANLSTIKHRGIDIITSHSSSNSSSDTSSSSSSSSLSSFVIPSDRPRLRLLHATCTRASPCLSCTPLSPTTSASPNLSTIGDVAGFVSLSPTTDPHTSLSVPCYILPASTPTCLRDALRHLLALEPHLFSLWAVDRTLPVFLPFAIRNAGSLAHALHAAFKVYRCRPLLGILRDAINDEKQQQQQQQQHDQQQQQQHSRVDIVSTLSSLPFPTWISYDSMYQTALRLTAATGHGLGIRSGSFVGICMQNRPEWLLADAVCVLNGYVSVGIMPQWPDEEIAHVLSHTEASLLFVDSDALVTIQRILDTLAASTSSSSGSPVSSSTSSDGAKLKSLKCIVVVPNGGGCVDLFNHSESAVRSRNAPTSNYTSTSSISILPPSSSSTSLSSRSQLDDSSASIKIIGIHDLLSSAPPVSECITLLGIRLDTPADFGAPLPPQDRPRDPRFEQHESSNSNVDATSSSSSSSSSSSLSSSSSSSSLSSSSSSSLASSGPAPITNPKGIVGLIYSSGSSGVPRGVIETQERFLVYARALLSLSRVVTCSYASLAHGMDRGMCWTALMQGGRVLFATFVDQPLQQVSLERQGNVVNSTSSSIASPSSPRLASHLSALPAIDLVIALQLAEPSLFVAFPRHFDHALADFEEDSASTSSPASSSSNSSLITTMRSSASLDRFIVASPHRLFLGRSPTHINVGGAPVTVKTLDFMKAIFPFASVHDNYGSTEVPGISQDGVVARGMQVKLLPLNQDDLDVDIDVSSTSSPCPHASSRWIKRGELLVKTPLASPGYFRDPEATAQAYDSEGWYHTGDLAEMDTPNSPLRVVGRVGGLAELYVDGRSAWTDLGRLEQLYGQSDLVSRILVHSDRFEPYLIALVHPSASAVAKVEQSKERLRELLLNALATIHEEAKLQDFEKIYGIVLVTNEDLTSPPTCVTALGKIRRQALMDRMQNAIREETLRVAAEFPSKH